MLFLRPCTKRIAALLLLLLPSCLYGVDPCARPLFPGFDSRLQIQYLGRVPASKDPIVGFEVVNGRPVVAFPHAVIAFEQRHGVRSRVAGTIDAIAADQGGNLWLQTVAAGNGGAQHVLKLQKEGFVEDHQLRVPQNSALHDSGNPVFLEVTREPGGAKLSALRRDGVEVYITSVRGDVRALSWNEVGLASVAGAGIYVWQAGGNDLVRLAVDEGFSKARDIVLVGPDRVVVSLENYVILIGTSGQTVIVGARARCRFAQGVLYLLDERGGFLWALRGIENLGDRNTDREYARRLIQLNPRNASETSGRYLEAVRIVGCEQAKTLRADALKNTAPNLDIRDVRAGLPESVHALSEPGVIPPKRISPPGSIATTPGMVKIALVIGADGAVRSGSVTAAPMKQMGDDALERARTWRYEPAQKDGRPIAVRLEESVPVPTPGDLPHGATASDPTKYFEDGQALIRSGKYTEAVAAFERAIRADPGLAEAYYQKGLALVASSPVAAGGKVAIRTGAVEALKRYVELSPKGEHATSAREMLKSIVGQ